MHEVLALSLITKLVLLNVVICAAENVWILHKYQAAISGIALNRTAHPSFYQYQKMLALCSGVLAMTTLAAPATSSILFSLSAILASQLVFNFQSSKFLYQAADKNHLTVVLALLVMAESFQHSPGVAKICLCFIAAHTILAYSVSGISKLFCPQWRSGEWLRFILTDSGYKSPWFNSIVQKYSLSWKAISWLVISFEVLSPLMIILPQPLMLCYLFIAFVFHLGVFALWGLNHFLIVFVASFPAIIWCNSML